MTASQQAPVGPSAEADAGARRELRGQVVRFAGVGVLSTGLHLGLFVALERAGLGGQLANGVALVIATVCNTAANRWWTFGVVGRDRLVMHHGQALLIFAITWVATTAALAVLDAVASRSSTLTQTIVVAVANVLSTAVRFVAMRSWIFRSPA
ncbi:MAG TPA: GtrA family protein [Intrasporangium sp.]|nr:GtrA family protein [Intrasporangium sp.]